MRPVNVFQMEIKSVFSETRSFLMRMGIAILLGFPFAVAAMPLRVKVSGITILLVFTAFFGAAVGTVRRRTDGITGRLRLLPIPPGIVQGDILLSGALIDLMQVGSIFGLYIIVNGRDVTVPALIAIAGTLVVAVMLLNLLGMALGALLRKNSEVHLFAALSVGCIALLSGIIPAPSRLHGIINAATTVNPVAWTAVLLRSISEGDARHGTVQVFLAAAVLCVTAAFTVLRGMER